MDFSSSSKKWLTFEAFRVNQKALHSHEASKKKRSRIQSSPVPNGVPMKIEVCVMSQVAMMLTRMPTISVPQMNPRWAQSHRQRRTHLRDDGADCCSDGLDIPFSYSSCSSHCRLRRGNGFIVGGGKARRRASKKRYSACTVRRLSRSLDVPQELPISRGEVLLSQGEFLCPLTAGWFLPQ